MYLQGMSLSIVLCIKLTNKDRAMNKCCMMLINITIVMSGPEGGWCRRQMEGDGMRQKRGQGGVTYGRE